MENSEREKLLKYAQTEEDRLFMAKLLDKANQADRGYLTYTHFLDPHQRSIARRVSQELGLTIIFAGGYPEAERAVGLFLPDYMVFATEAETIESLTNNVAYPIALVQVDHKRNAFAKELTHRDYLGALMSLGIKRETIGDILVNTEFAQIIVLSEFTEYLENDLTQIGRVTVEAKTVKLSQLVTPTLKTEEKIATVASLRLDAVVAEGFNLSRSEASGYIVAGKVYLQFEECSNVSKQVNEGNTISLKGTGRIVLEKINGLSRKNRIFITLKKFV